MLGLVIAVAILSAFFVPVIQPGQFGVDICPHSSLVSAPYVSLSFLLLRYGTVYFVGHGYYIWMNPDC